MRGLRCCYVAWPGECTQLNDCHIVLLCVRTLVRGSGPGLPSPSPSRLPPAHRTDCSESPGQMRRAEEGLTVQ